MNAKTAKETAGAWVRLHTESMKGYRGAYFSGSIIGLPDDAEVPETSDVDVVIVIADDEAPPKLGKFVYQGVLLEVTYLPWRLFDSYEEVLTAYHLAGSFRKDTLIGDPTGHLGKLQRQVSSRFAERYWVRRRCENVREKIENGLRMIDYTAPLPNRIMSWLFPTGVTTHLLLTAALRNPTVRRRYQAAREVLIEYGCEDLYPALLQLLGCGHLTAGRIERHLDALARTFDAAAAAARTPFFFSSDITSGARPIAIDGSRELIRNGFHHEAVFWIAATYCRCHIMLAADAPDRQPEYMPAFEAILADLGVDTPDAMGRRAEEVLLFLPKVWETAEAIMDANPAIKPSDSP